MSISGWSGAVDIKQWLINTITPTTSVMITDNTGAATLLYFPRPDSVVWWNYRAKYGNF